MINSAISTALLKLLGKLDHLADLGIKYLEDKVKPDEEEK